MAAQENVALARSLLEMYNSRQSDPAWLDKSGAAFAADCEVIDIPSGTTLHGPDGYKRLVRFFAEAFPDSRTKLTNAFATEDQVTLEFTSRGTNIGLLHLPSQVIPATGRSFELPSSFDHLSRFLNRSSRVEDVDFPWRVQQLYRTSLHLFQPCVESACS